MKKTSSVVGEGSNRIIWKAKQGSNRIVWKAQRGRREINQGNALLMDSSVPTAEATITSHVRAETTHLVEKSPTLPASEEEVLLRVQMMHVPNRLPVAG